ncbi:MAG: outer membrane lipid asymmetry maintenance protein MlaD [Burkholderiales bacterium]
MERKVVDFWVGLFVVAGFAALLMLALKVGNFGAYSPKNVYVVKAHFDNIGGLKARAPVRSSGVLVGRVDAINFDTKKYDAEVTLTMDGDYKFPTDTTASVLTSGILGENYVGLEAGGDTENLKQGDVIKITQSAVVLEKLISQFLFNKAQENTSDKEKK